MNAARVVGLLWLLASSLLDAAGHPCSQSAEIVDTCFDVHGRLSFWNGAPSARIWRVGTSRMLGIHHDELPVELASQMTTFDTEAWGDFRVCPFTKERTGHMQMVCIDSWRNIRFRERTKGE
jgi:hypothetical protein